MNLIEIFRAGTRKDANGNLVTISRDDLQKAVDNYSAEYHEAPIVIGHPKTDTPAFGWIAGLQLDGDVLKAHTKQVDTEFAELVREGKYKKISSAFYLPKSASNPKPDGFYLRHVGFLGAMPPAVKGLADPIFNDNEADVVEFSDTEVVADNVPNLVSEPEPKNEPETPTDTQGAPDMSEHDKARLAELEAENSRLKAEQAQMLKAQAEAANAEFAESLITEGKLIPRLKETALELLNTDHGSAEFSEVGFKDQLKAFLSDLPKAVEFNEIATKENAAEAQDESVAYAEGTDPSLIEADKRVKAYMKAHSVDYTTAFKQVFN